METENMFTQEDQANMDALLKKKELQNSKVRSIENRLMGYFISHPTDFSDLKEYVAELEPLLEEYRKYFPTHEPLWYPDGTGKWIEIDWKTMPHGPNIPQDTIVEFLMSAERYVRRYTHESRVAGLVHWSPKVVAYKVVA
jgi:hypothetical protein